MQNWVIIDEKYLAFLRATEHRIPYSDYGTNKYKRTFNSQLEKSQYIDLLKKGSGANQYTQN